MKLIKLFNLKNIILALAIIFILSLNVFPNIYAYLNTPKNMVFSGQATWFDPWDINIYASSIKSGQVNGFLLPNNYTTITNKPIFMYPLYTTLGIIFKDLNPFIVFHFTATFSGLILAMGIFFLLKIFLKDIIERICALIGICLGGGFGFFLYPKLQSADLAMTSFTFQSTFQRPHEAIGLIFYISSLICFYLLFIQQTKKYLILTTSSLLISLLFYPYYILSFFAIAGVFLFLKNKGKLIFSQYKYLLFLFPLSLIPTFWLFQQISSNETFNGVSSQNLSTPDPVYLLIGYGIIFPLIVYQLFKVKKDNGIIFLNIWFFVSLLLALLPFGFSRFYLRGLFFPAVILGIFALNNISIKIKINKYILLIIFIIILLPSTLKITYARITDTFNNNPWYYFSGNEHKGIEYLNKQNKNKNGVLSLYRFGNVIPAHTNNNVYFGHSLQTPQMSNKLQNLYNFYTIRLTEKEAKTFINNNNISYIIWGKEEKGLAETERRNVKEINSYYSFLTPVFKTDDLTIFEVK